MAEEALELGWDLHSPLPFSRDEYRNDFAGDQESLSSYDSLLAKAEAVLELDGILAADSAQGKQRSRSYEAVGRALLNQSDLLVAVWDGESSRGIGGTAQIVNEALHRGIPVVWIDWTQAVDWKLHVPWRVLHESDGHPPAFDQLSKLVRDLLLPPASDSIADVTGGPDLREAYFAESRKSWRFPLGWQWSLFRDLWCGDLWARRSRFRVDNSDVSFRKQWSESAADASSDESCESTAAPAIPGDLLAHIDETMSPHYSWANSLSIYYADLYRSSFVLNYLFGALAVLFALFGLVTPSEGAKTIREFWISAEFVLIVFIIGLTQCGRHWHWHERWIDYRSLAERLRLAHFLALLGGGGQQVSLPGHLISYGNPASTWMHWHYRAIERAAGLPTVSFSEEYLKICKACWCVGLVQEQERYHVANERRFHRLDHRIHFAGAIAFFATTVFCVLHLCLDDKPAWRSGLLTLLAGTLPAIGAAFAGIRSQGEFQRLTRRTAAMHGQLSELGMRLAAVPTRSCELNSVRFRATAEELTSLMINEMLDWRVVFQDRPLILPA